MNGGLKSGSSKDQGSFKPFTPAAAVAASCNPKSLTHDELQTYSKKNQKEVSPTQMLLTFITGLSVYKHVLFVLTLFLKKV